MTIKDYPKIFAVGHRAIPELLTDDVVVEEKLDGSQFSFGKYGGVLKARSKNKELYFQNPEKLFAEGLEYVKSIESNLIDGTTYRGEYFKKPKHNTLAYGRIPNNHIMIFDIEYSNGEHVHPDIRLLNAQVIGLESVPIIKIGKIENIEEFKSFLDRESVLGLQKIEGVVVKNYNRLNAFGLPSFGKFVSEAFKELNNGEFRAQNPSKADVIEKIIYNYTTPARWEKAIQHLRDKGELKGSPEDIGSLLREVNLDVLTECKDEIAAKLFDYAWPKISRGITKGLPMWYKERLVGEAFNG